MKQYGDTRLNIVTLYDRLHILCCAVVSFFIAVIIRDYMAFQDKWAFWLSQFVMHGALYFAFRGSPGTGRYLGSKMDLPEENGDTRISIK